MKKIKSLLFVLLFFVPFTWGQINGNFKSVRFVNVNDSTTIVPFGVNGTIYYNNQSNKFRVYTNGAWTDLGTGAAFSISSNPNELIMNVGGTVEGQPDVIFDPDADNFFIANFGILPVITGTPTTSFTFGNSFVLNEGVTSGFMAGNILMGNGHQYNITGTGSISTNISLGVANHITANDDSDIRSNILLNQSNTISASGNGDVLYNIMTGFNNQIILDEADDFAAGGIIASRFSSITNNSNPDIFGTVILGGQDIDIVNPTTSTVYMPKIVIGRGTGGTLPVVSGGEDALFYDATTGEVRTGSGSGGDFWPLTGTGTFLGNVVIDGDGNELEISGQTDIALTTSNLESLSLTSSSITLAADNTPININTSADILINDGSSSILLDNSGDDLILTGGDGFEYGVDDNTLTQTATTNVYDGGTGTHSYLFSNVLSFQAVKQNAVTVGTSQDRIVLGTQGNQFISSNLTTGSITQTTNQDELIQLLSEPSSGLGYILEVEPTGITITDETATPVGAVYASDYTATFTDRSLVDKAYVDTFNPLTMITDTVNLAGWDMDADATLSRSFTDTGLASIAGSQIMELQVIISNDAGTVFYPINTTTAAITQGGVDNWTDTAPLTLTLNRLLAGTFDSTDFDDDTLNRGYVLVTYLP